jgi:hypothetical protein
VLRSSKILIGYDILAQDGKIGKVHDFYFDDDQWTIRYLVVDTGPWILGRKVLISPEAVGRPDWITKNFPVDLTRQQVKDSPEIDADLHISRQQELTLSEHYH